MLRKRLIFTLIYNNGFFTQSRNFRLQNVGDLNWLNNNYNFSEISKSIDELIIIDATKKSKDINRFSEILNKLSENVFIPITAGGGIRSVNDAKVLFSNGADKLLLNTTIYNDKLFVEELASIFGEQSLIASVDYKTNGDKTYVYIQNGEKMIEYNLIDYIKRLNDFPIGEIFLNSIDKDGTGFGYDINTIKNVTLNLNKPLIISGGAGNFKHLVDGLKISQVSAVSTANLFNFMGTILPESRNELLNKGYNLADWTKNSNYET